MPQPKTLLAGLAEAPGWQDRRLWFTDICACEVIAANWAGNLEDVAPVRTLDLAFIPVWRLVVISGEERPFQQ